MIAKSVDTDRDFNTMLDESRVTELKIQAFFQARGYTVIDKSDDPLYQKMDVDFLIEMEGQPTLKVEVKSDNVIATSNRIFIERFAYRKTGYHKGWLHYCQADIICYHDAINNKGYLIDWQKMKEKVHTFSSRTFKNIYDTCYTSSYLVPLSEALEDNFILEEYAL